MSSVLAVPIFDNAAPTGEPTAPPGLDASGWTLAAVDPHKATSTCALYDLATERTETRRLKTTREQFHQLIASRPGTWIVAVEACRQSQAVCNWLIEAGAQVILADATKLAVAAKLRPTKSDRSDARLILELLMRDDLPRAYLAPPQVQQLRLFMRGYRTLVEACTARRNILRLQATQVGLPLPWSDVCSKDAREQLPGMLQSLPALTGQALLLTWQSLLALEAQRRSYQKAIEEQAEAHAVASRLMVLSGVGAITALGLVAEIGDIRRFPTPRHLHSYAGVVPQTSQSDKWQQDGHLVNRCSRHLRGVVLRGAQGAARAKAPSRAKAAYGRVSGHARGGHHSGLIAAGRALLTEVFVLWHEVVRDQAVGSSAELPAVEAAPIGPAPEPSAAEATVAEQAAAEAPAAEQRPPTATAHEQDGGERVGRVVRRSARTRSQVAQEAGAS